MVKTVAPYKTLQLTWQGDKWCKITEISKKPDGSFSVDKETKIAWGYDNE
jgi:hypothetical protein